MDWKNLQAKYSTKRTLLTINNWFSCLWGPSLHTDSLSHLRWLHNLYCSGFCKWDHGSNHKECLEWLPVDLFARYRSLSKIFTPAGVFLSTLNHTHYYEARCPLHHITAVHPRKAFCQRPFWLPGYTHFSAQVDFT